MVIRKEIYIDGEIRAPPKQVIVNPKPTPRPPAISNPQPISGGTQQIPPRPSIPSPSKHFTPRQVKPAPTYPRLKPWMDKVVFPMDSSPGERSINSMVDNVFGPEINPSQGEHGSGSKINNDEVMQAFKAIQEQVRKAGGDTDLYIFSPEKENPPPAIQAAKKFNDEELIRKVNITGETIVPSPLTSDEKFLLSEARLEYGTKLNPGAEQKLSDRAKNYFYLSGQNKPQSGFDALLDTWFETSPWGMFTPQGAPKIKENKKYEKEIWVGRILGEAATIGSSYLIGGVFGGAAGAVSGAGSKLSKVGKVIGAVTGKLPRPAVGAIKGTAKGVFLGGIGALEGAKGVKMWEQGYTIPEIVAELGGDFASMYSFEKGFTSAFVATRKNVIRKNFADKNSRLFIDQKPQVVKDETGNTLFIRMKGVKEIPDGWPGSISTKPRPSKTFKLIEKPKPSKTPFVKPPSKPPRTILLDDELKFLSNERLPAALRTEKQLVQRGDIVKSGDQLLKIMSGASKSITKEIASVSRSRTAIVEATRVMNTKRAYSAATKIPNTIKGVSALLGAVNFGITSNDLLPLPPKTQKSTDLSSGSGSGQSSGKNNAANDLFSSGKGGTSSGPSNGYSYDPFRWKKWPRPDALVEPLNQYSGSGGSGGSGVTPGSGQGGGIENDWWKDYGEDTSTDRGKGVTPNFKGDEDQVPDYVPDYSTDMRQDPFQSTGPAEVPFEIPAAVGLTATIAGFTGYRPPTRVRKGRVPIILPKGGSIFGSSGSAWWKKSGRKNKNKIFSFGPIKVDILPKSSNSKSSKRKTRKKRRR